MEKVKHNNQISTIDLSTASVDIAGLSVYVEMYKRTFAIQILNIKEPSEESINILTGEMKYAVELITNKKLGNGLVDVTRLTLHF